MNIRDMFDNEFLAADDLRDKPWTLTIASVAPKQLRKQGGKVDKRPIVRFLELEAKATKDKPALGLVLNRTNAKTLKALYGKDTAAWVGKRVTIFPTTCDSFGKRNVPCIRIEDSVPSAKSKSEAPPSPPEPVDEPGDDAGPEPPADYQSPD